MIILFGPAGSGKSTQGQILARRLGWKWLSVGQVIRDTGQFEEITQAGGLVDDKIVIELMRKEMEEAEMEGMNVILDGYPRDEVQAKWVQKEMRGKLEGAMILEVPEEELLRRIEVRGRNDDTAEVVQRRFKVFWEHIAKILPILEEMGVPVVRVNGVGEFEEVTKRLIAQCAKWNEEAGTVNDEGFADGVEKERSYGE